MVYANTARPITSVMTSRPHTKDRYRGRLWRLPLTRGRWLTRPPACSAATSWHTWPILGICRPALTTLCSVGFLDRFRQAPGSTGLHLHFAAVDVETTGLDPVEDRIVELAVVLFDAQGTVLDEWTTLVNPGDGDAGVVAIHGIQSEWLAAAADLP